MTATRRRRFAPDPELVAMLAEMLEAAKSGDVREVFVVWADPDRETFWRYYAYDIDNLVYEARVATGEIRRRGAGEPGEQ